MTIPNSAQASHILANCDNWLYTPSFPSYVSVGKLDVTGNQLTVEGEFNMTQPYMGGPLLGADVAGKYSDPSDCNYLLRAENAQITTTTGFYQTPEICDLEINKTYHVAMVYDGSTLSFYRNGFLMSQIAATGNLVQNNWLTQIGLYQDYVFYNVNLIGYINEVRIWNVARTQAQIQAFMNTPLPSPTTQTGLLAYYSFNDLLNKQGNPAWNGTLGGSAGINKTNPTCASFVADNDCCPVLTGTLSGNTICPGATGQLTFHSTTPIKLPYTLTYSDGSNTYTQDNVQDGAPFAVAVQPTTTTVYSLVSIQGAATCPATPISGQTTKITVNNACCAVLQGTLTGNTICSGSPGYLIFHCTTAGTQPPYTVMYSDGSTTFVQNNVQDGVPFAVSSPPTTTTLYSLVSIQDAGTCPATAISGPQGTIIVRKCDQCSNWLGLPSSPSYVELGDLDIPGNQITVEAEINRTTPYSGGTTFAGDIVSKHKDPVNINYLLRPNSAEITTADGVYHITPPICDIQLNKTYHVAMVYDGASLKFYRNGFLMSQVAVTGNLFQNDFPTRIGLYQAMLYNENFIGYINEVRIWNVARTQVQLQTYMNTSLPSPATQTGLLAYYTFSDLLNKQGNPAWNGTIGGTAAINQTNPTCASFVADDDCCPVYSGTLSGNTICSGATALLTFHSATPITEPVVITYSDGTNAYVHSGVRDGIPFAVDVQPTATTTYTLLSIRKTVSCPANIISGKTATINFTNCFCSGSLGDPVLNVSFGSGANPGGLLSTAAPGASTTLSYIPVSGNPALPALVDGQYTITNNIPSDPNWFGGASDHTAGDGKGYMAVYHSGTQSAEFYNRQIDNLCGETTYQFAAWIANAVNPAVLAGVPPNISFLVEQTNGVILGSYSTGPIPENATLTWRQYGFFFTVPEDVSSVVLKIVNNNTDGAAANDFAIDDISLRACGPLSTASFNAFGASLTQTVCEGSWAMLYGSVSAGYQHPVNLWQQSADNGVTWTDMANSASLQFSITTPVTGLSKTYLYRMLTAEQNNIQSPSCRVVSNTISLLADAGPILKITGDTSICSGSSLTLQVTGGNTYSWSPAQFLDNPGIANPVAAPVTATKFVVVASDPQLCETKDSVSISIRPEVLFKQPEDVSACFGDRTVLKSSNDPGFIYSWSPADNLDNPSAANPVSSAPVSTQYTMHVSDPFCKAEADFPITLTVNPLPSVTASSANDIDCINGISQLKASGGEKYSWSPTEGLNDPDIVNPVASVDSTTTFTVTAEDANGCSGSAFVKIIVTDHGKASFILPNAFTPNFDGVNDCFGIRKWGNVSLKEFSIYNRWGQRVFYTQNPSECWNGTFHGEMQDPGGYVYVIKGISFCGVINRSGTFLLIR